MTKRSKKTVPEDVPEEDNDAGTSNDLDEIETVLETAPEPTEVVNNDVMLPRSASRYVPPLR